MSETNKGISSVESPPSSIGGILTRLGPGLIVAGSIVGSGELIATTRTGAEAGFWLLWLIIVGCVIKVLVQVEFGRYTIVNGRTTMDGLNEVPGPRLGSNGNWIVWFWFVMFLASLGQLGGIVGGVGQSLALAVPLKGDYAEAIQVPSEKELKSYIGWTRDKEDSGKAIAALEEEERSRVEASLKIVKGRLDKLNENFNGKGDLVHERVATLIDAEIEQHKAKEAGGDTAESDKKVSDAKALVTELTEPDTNDDKIWAAIVTVLTIAMIYQGKYGLIQNFSTVLVVTFTFITLGNVISLQLNPQFAIPTDVMFSGLIPTLPATSTAPPGIIGWVVANPLATALATFGIIGVGASELVAYPYWCLEKGYGRYTGPRSDDAAWATRARGWMKVMLYDASASMIIYTVATIAFFIMGVAVMHRQGLNPSGMRMVSTLMEQYVPVFGAHAKWLFLFGAIAVLYSTFLVANAGFTRMYTDALKVYGFLDPANEKGHKKSISFFAVLLPTICLAIFASDADPVALVLLGGTMQAIMLPMLGFATLFFRYKMTDERLKPTGLWDVFLIISSIGLFIAGGWQAYSKLS